MAIKNKKTAEFIKKASSFQGVLTFLAIIGFVSYSYLLLFLIICSMLPTIVVLITDIKNKEKLFIVGFFNFGGSIFWIINFIVDYSYPHISQIFANIWFYIASYGFAGLGVFAYYKFPAFLVFFLKKYNEQKLNKINKELEKIQNQWGEI